MTNVQLYKELAKGFTIRNYALDLYVYDLSCTGIPCSTCCYHIGDACIRTSAWNESIPEAQVTAFKLEYPEFFI